MGTKVKENREKGQRLFLLLAAGLASAALLLGAYLWHLSAVIDKRFSARRWSVPSTIYSDSTLLFPGQRINEETLKEKLRRLAYRTVAAEPGRMGEMRWQGNLLEIFLHDLDMPSNGETDSP